MSVVCVFVWAEKKVQHQSESENLLCFCWCVLLGARGSKQELNINERMRRQKGDAAVTDVNVRHFPRLLPADVSSLGLPSVKRITVVVEAGSQLCSCAGALSLSPDFSTLTHFTFYSDLAVLLFYPE